MKKCLIFTRTTTLGGAEKIILELLNGIRGNDLELHVAAVDTRGNQLGDYLSTRQAMRGSFDLIHTHLFLPGLLIRLRRLYDSSFVWVHTVHYEAYDGQRWARVKRFLDYKFIFPSTDQLIAVSESVAHNLKQQPKLQNRVTTILNCVRAFREEANLDESSGEMSERSAVVIGAVSMLRVEKGLKDLVSAVALIRDEGVPVKLKIAGEGPEHENLSRQIEQLKLQGHVELVGYVNKISDFYRKIDIFANVSHIESFGLAILEAMQFRLPIVASAVGEAPRLLQNGRFGVLVPRLKSKRAADFPQALKIALLKAAHARRYYRRLASEGYRYHRALLTPERLVQAHATLYREFLRPGVCMVSPVVTHATGGIQRQLYLQSRELHRLGYRVFVLQKFDSQLDLRDPRWSHVDWLQTPLLLPRTRLPASLRARVDGTFFILAGLVKLFQIRRSVNVIHAHQLFSPTLLGFLAKKLFGARLVVKVTASGEYGEKNELRRLPFWQVRERAFQSIDRVIVLSQEMKDEMRELGFEESKLALIPNSVETCPERVETESSNQAFKLLFTGRLSKEKSLETLLIAANQLAEVGVECEVTLLGGSSFGGRDSEHELRQLAESLNPRAKICFAGTFSNIEPFYQAADVFVLPSISEGMSNALLEAMAHGLPCVVSDIAANQFVVTNEKDGLIFKVGDSSDLARQLLRLVNDERGRKLRRALSAAAQATVRERFDVAQIGSKIDRLYREIQREAL